jgi:hypothetical protein
MTTSLINVSRKKVSRKCFQEKEGKACEPVSGGASCGYETV